MRDVGAIMGVGSGAMAPPDFQTGTNIVDRGLKVLFSIFFAIFDLFPLPPPLRKRLN